MYSDDHFGRGFHLGREIKTLRALYLTELDNRQIGTSYPLCHRADGNQELDGSSMVTPRAAWLSILAALGDRGRINWMRVD